MAADEQWPEREGKGEAGVPVSEAFEREVLFGNDGGDRDVGLDRYQQAKVWGVSLPADKAANKNGIKGRKIYVSPQLWNNQKRAED
jgi:hypothetical protein